MRKHQTLEAKRYGEQAKKLGELTSLETMSNRQHDPISQYHLARCYAFGIMVAQSDKTALKYYQEAANAGVVEAKSKLERMVQDGRANVALPAATGRYRIAHKPRESMQRRFLMILTPVKNYNEYANQQRDHQIRDLQYHINLLEERIEIQQSAKQKPSRHKKSTSSQKLIGSTLYLG